MLELSMAWRWTGGPDPFKAINRCESTRSKKRTSYTHGGGPDQLILHYAHCKYLSTLSIHSLDGLVFVHVALLVEDHLSIDLHLHGSVLESRDALDP